MSNNHLFRGSLCAAVAALAALSCAGNSNQADPYNGVIFTTDYVNNTAFDSKFLAGDTATTCPKDPTTSKNDALFPTYPCYEAQEGYANGSPVWFYNFGALKYCSPGATCAAGSLPNPLPVSVADPQTLGGGGAHVDVFPHSCTPGPAYNPETDTYPRDSQFPIFNALPLATTTYGAIVYPIVATYGVSTTSNETCNDLKDSRSIADASNPGGGSYGATRTAQPTSYQMWAAIDMTANVGGPFPGQLNPNWGPAFAWYKGLMLRYLDGGPIPTQPVNNPDGSTSLAFVAMDGVILDSATAYANTTDQKVILLPAAPGDDAYSPIVNLHDYKMAAGQTPGSFVGICTASMTNCPSNYVNFAKASATPYSTIFIASTPQQGQ